MSNVSECELSDTEVVRHVIISKLLDSAYKNLNRHWCKLAELTANFLQDVHNTTYETSLYNTYICCFCSSLTTLNRLQIRWCHITPSPVSYDAKSSSCTGEERKREQPSHISVVGKDWGKQNVWIISTSVGNGTQCTSTCFMRLGGRRVPITVPSMKILLITRAREFW